MKSTKFIPLLLIIVISLSSCSLFNGTLTNSKMMSIQKGMTKDEILRLLRTPYYRNFNQETEEWVYIAEDKNLIIGFYNDLVETMNTYPAGTYYNRSAYPEYNNSSYSPQYSPSYPPVNYDSSAREREFQYLYESVKRETFKDDQLQTLRSGVYNRSFTVNQVVRMMSIYTFDDDKLKVLEIMASGIIDREYQMVIKDALTFNSSWEKAQNIINNAFR